MFVFPLLEHISKADALKNRKINHKFTTAVSKALKAHLESMVGKVKG